MLKGRGFPDLSWDRRLQKRRFLKHQLHSEKVSFYFLVSFLSPIHNSHQTSAISSAQYSPKYHTSCSQTYPQRESVSNHHRHIQQWFPLLKKFKDQWLNLHCLSKYLAEFGRWKDTILVCFSCNSWFTRIESCSIVCRYGHWTRPWNWACLRGSIIGIGGIFRLL